MKHGGRISTSLYALALAALPAAAADRLDDLEGPMRGFDSVADVAPAMAGLPVPRRAGEPDALPPVQIEPDVAPGTDAEFDADAERKRALNGAFAAELERDVREGFVVDREFEPTDGGASLLVPAEDHFHEEEGEDVDLEDEFNDVPPDPGG